MSWAVCFKIAEPLWFPARSIGARFHVIRGLPVPRRYLEGWVGGSAISKCRISQATDRTKK